MHKIWNCNVTFKTVYFISITAGDEKVKQEIDLVIEMMVEVRVHGKPYYGVVKWLGSVEFNGKMENMAGLEMVC